MKPDTIIFAARVANLDAANAFVEACYDRFNLHPEKKFSVLLALEEAFVNICHHAYIDGAGDIEISCQLENEAFVLEIADKGKSFDMLSLPAPDTTLDIEDRPIGGLGILLIRTLSNSADYRRDDDRNVLRMVFAERDPDMRPDLLA